MFRDDDVEAIYALAGCRTVSDAGVETVVVAALEELPRTDAGSATGLAGRPASRLDLRTCVEVSFCTVVYGIESLGCSLSDDSSSESKTTRLL